MIRLAIVDDHPIVLDGLASLLEQQPNIEVKGTCTAAHELYELLNKTKLDLAIVDINMPNIDGIDVINHIKQKHSSTKILVLSMHQEEALLRRIVSLGAEGYLRKDAHPKQILEAIRRVYKYGVYLDHESSEVLVSALRKDVAIPESTKTQADTDQKPEISQRELEVIKLVALGQSVREIAENLHISYNTVKSHKKNIFSKLEVNSNAELVSVCHQLKLI